MSEDTKPHGPTTLEENNTLKDSSIDEFLQSAQTELLTIRGLVETAKAAVTDTTESQKLITIALDNAQTKVGEITAIATQALAAKTQITDEQAVIATKSEHIQKAQEHADKVRADLDRELTQAKQHVTTIEAQKLSAQSSSENAAKFLADIQKNKGVSDTEITAVVAARKTAEESAALTKNLAEKSATVEDRIAFYEKRLADIETQCTNQLQKIEKLLPGATSAGLAHDFDKRRETFLEPHNRWQWIFIGSVLTLVVLAVTGLIQVYYKTPQLTYDDVLLLWVSRLPLAGALVWLALHASRESALAKRLEEDYGYKAAIASCLVGFQKQMSDLDKDVTPNSPLAKLLENTLETIAAPPGRIYDKHKLTVSPITEVAEATKEVTQNLVEKGANKLGLK